MGIGGNRGTSLPFLLVALAALAGTLGAWLGLEAGGYTPHAVTARILVGTGEPYSFVDSPPVADGSGGIWATTEDALAFGTDRKAGALIHLGRDGSSRSITLPTTNSYPSDPALATDGALWFVYAQGDGSSPSVDTGPDLRDEVDTLARRTADGAVARFPIPAPDSSPHRVRFTVPGADGSVWFGLYTQHGDVYGRCWPDGRGALYQVPDGIPYLSALTPEPDGTVWLAALGQTEELLRVRPATATVLARIVVPGSSPFDAIAGPVPAAGSAVWIETGSRGAVRVGPSGEITATVPGSGTMAQAFAGDGAGGIWVLRPYADARPLGLGDLERPAGAQGPAGPAQPALLRHIGADGSAVDYRPTLASGDGAYRHITVASDGAVWLTAGGVVERFG